MPRCPAALPETYEYSPARSPRIGINLRIVHVSSFIHQLLPSVKLLRALELALPNKAIPGPLQSPSALNEINHYHHESDDQKNVNDCAHGVGDYT